ncbi:hypothetical protein HPP92_017720 [Vanilla planifolia]|uniref:C3HC-type domain-containing protein n=1 Tax=Vanilla planifolia TaxID=51239 RepID=A0A835Q8E5_VANPL|nr:hypothetical protein HPP92_017720 [Vanilla planifolia]
MREEVISSGTVEAVALAGSSPPPTPAASSVAVSSHIVPANAGSTDCLGSAQSSKAGSLSSAAAHASWTSMSNNVGNSTAGSSEILCRPWERGDLLHRLATFELSNWFGKPKGANSLACARRGWVNIGFDKIECELCGSCLTLTTSASQTICEEAFAEKLDSGHIVMCPWRGNVCADSLVQFPPTLASALIGAYKDRCDELTQFPFLPVIASYVVEFMRLSRVSRLTASYHNLLFLLGEMGFKADNMPVADLPREDSFWHHSQRIISLCGWEPRWLPNVQDCEEYSAQSARNACSIGHKEEGYHHARLAELSKNTLASIEKKNHGKEKLVLESRCNLSSLLLDCSLCGVTVRVSDFLTIPRQAQYGLMNNGDSGTFKKLVQTHGTSAASGINGCLGEDGLEDQQENRDETATTDFRKSSSNAGVNMNIITTEIFPSIQPAMLVDADPSDDGGMGRDLTLGQPAESEVGDRAGSFESRGPSTRKRSIEEGGSTVDRPQDRAQRADSIEGTVVDHDVDEFDGCSHESSLSKHARRLEAFNSPNLSRKMDFSGAGPSHGYFGMTINRLNSFKEGSDLAIRHSATRDSARASSVVAMDTICGSDDEDSMESVENHPRDFDGTNLNSIMNVSEYSYSNLAQHSTCVLHASGSVAREIGGSSTIDGDEVLDKETFAANARDMFSLGISGVVWVWVLVTKLKFKESMYLRQAHSDIGDAELIAEVTENVVQCGESAAEPGLMDESALDVLRKIFKMISRI